MKKIERRIFRHLKVGIIYLSILFAFILYCDRTVVQAQETMPSNPKVSDGTTTWDCIYFGNFPQKDMKGEAKQPIKWRVLYVEESDAFLIADHILYQMDSVSRDGMDVNWKNNNIRAWLNSYSMENFHRVNADDEFYNNGFLNTGFTESEKKAIIKQSLGDDCNDYIYLPSKDEMLTSTYGFSNDEAVADPAKIAQVTAFVDGRGLGLSEEYAKPYCYYLRDFSLDPVYVNEGLHMDEIHRDGKYSPTLFWVHGLGVRPVLHLDLSKEVWSNAGTVRSDIAIEKTSGDYKYYIYDDEAVISAYNGTESSVSIPDTIDGYPVGYVSYLDESSDNEEDDEDKPDTLQSVIFPNSVWGIGGIGGIGQDNLVNVTLGSGLKFIKYWTFSDCKTLKTINIPSGVEEIGDYAFSGCAALESITIPPSVKRIGEGAFSDVGDNFIMTVNKESIAEEYAKKNEIRYVYTDGTEPNNTIETDEDKTKENGLINASVPADEKASSPTIVTDNDDGSSNDISVQNEQKSINVQQVSPIDTVKINSLRNSTKKTFVVKWKKIKGIKGYEVQYALNKKFTKSKKTKNTTNITLTVKKLKKGKNYYVRVRAYNTDSKGKKFYGKWSAIKKVIIKR